MIGNFQSEPVSDFGSPLNFGPVNNWSMIFLSTQEGDWAFSASPEARVLRETGHEGYPHWPAHDLYTSHRLYGQLHEKVSCLLMFSTVKYTGGPCVTNLISVRSPQHPALRGHCVHVPVPRRRQVHVPLPGSEKGGHEQQWGEEWDLGGAVCNTNRGT